MKSKRKELRISQHELSKRLNISQSYLSKAENCNATNVNIEFIKKISNELNLNAVDVFLFFYENL